MSQENVELVRSICIPWESGDFSSIGWAHHEIEFAFADGPTPGTWTGAAAMAEAWREALSAWEGLDVKVERYVPLDDERVLVLMHNTGRGKASGLELDQLHTRGANLFHVREGAVTRLVLYWDANAPSRRWGYRRPRPPTRARPPRRATRPRRCRAPDRPRLRRRSDRDR